jgi:HEAT repeat protein
MAKRLNIEQALDELAAVRKDPASEASRDRLARGLASPSNLVIAKAANLVREYKLAGHSAAMADAFARLMADPYKLDKGAAALTAIAQGLLETRAGAEAELVYRAGVRHVQRDGPPGDPDTAGRLRGYCGLGLADLKTRDAMAQLADLLADPEPAARVAAARGLGRAGPAEAALVLRLKLRLGDANADVLGECMAGMLLLDPAGSLPAVVERLSHDEPEVRDAAAMALGESRLTAGLSPLCEHFAREPDAQSRKTALLAISLLRSSAAVDYLVNAVGTFPVNDAVAAVEALGLYRHDGVLRERVKEHVERRGEDPLKRAAAKAFPV